MSDAWISLSGVVVGSICTVIGGVVKDVLLTGHAAKKDVAIKYMLQRMTVYEGLYEAVDGMRYVKSSLAKQEELLNLCRGLCAKNYGHMDDEVRESVDAILAYISSNKFVTDGDREGALRILRGKMDAIRGKVDGIF